VSLYLDASVLVTLFVIDPSSDPAEAFLSAHPQIVVVSDFGVAEFSSAVGRRVRTRDLTREDGQLAFSNLDTWVAAIRITGRRSRLPISMRQLGFCGVLMSTSALRTRSTSRTEEPPEDLFQDLIKVHASVPALS
jgi:predicted nucleic acid-binding protein